MRRAWKILRVLLWLAVLLVATGWLVLRLPTFGGSFEGARLALMRASPHFHGDHFENTPPYISQLALFATAKAYLQDQVREPQFTIPVQPIAPEALRAPPAPGMRAFWMGHATVLVEIDGVRVLTDPVLSERASPFQFLGPQRFHPPPIALAQLAGIDAVVVSHDHYDHLDMDTVRQLAQGGTHFYVGLGVGAHLERWGVAAAQIHEMDWWQSADIKGVRIHATPARHYSGRKRMDDSTLWASWMVKGPRHTFYFSGDTGYAPHFAEIRQRLGPPDLALMKVGAYGSTWLDIHMDPESAIQSHLDLDAKVMLPVHWATFNLAYHAWEEPILRTLSAAKIHGVEVVTPQVGQPVEWGAPFRNEAWYLGPR